MKKAIFLLTALVMTALLGLQTLAAPYWSFMVDRDGHLRNSPGLYEPSHIIDVDAAGVNDMFIAPDDTIYIAVSGNTTEIIVLDGNENERTRVGSGILKSAAGVFADTDGLIYVADSTQAVVYVFNPDGTVVRTIAKPTSPLFGTNTPFKPMKLVVDRQKNLYILSEGTTNGIIQMNEEGAFLGYFGVNLADMTIFRKLQKMLFSEQMMSNFIKNVPPSMSNIAIDAEGLVYAVTKGDTKEPIKKINVAGANLFEDVLYNIYGNGQSGAPESVATDAYGNVFVLTGYRGHIFILDSLGNIVGIFGAKSEINAELGITSNPVAIGVDSVENIYVADKSLGQIIVYTPTPLMQTLYSALAYYKEGQYTESERLWSEVLMRNSSFALANNAIGLARLKHEDYAASLDYFLLANNRGGYSNAFWEVRQKFVMDNVSYVIVAVVILSVLKGIWNQVRKRTKALDGWYAAKARIGGTAFMQEAKTVTNVLRYPIDTFYDIRYYNTVKLPSALLLLAVAAGLLVAADYFTGFVFNTVDTSGTSGYNPIRNLMTYVVVLVLFVGSNYLIASINDGRGKLMQVFRATMLCLMPLAALYLPLIAVSNVLTLQEAFIFQLFQYVIFAWCGLLVFIMVMQVHDYEFGEALRSLLLTIFTMAIIFVIVMVIYMLAKEAVGFFGSILQEVVKNALG